jgi:hypothetical protein
MRKATGSFLTALSLLLGAGCVGDIGGSAGDDDTAADAGVASACAAGRSYTSFGGDALEATRVQLAAGADRVRIKPYDALATEYAKALGLSTFNTAAYAATFGRPPARWYIEPQASANTIYAAFALAYEACLQHTAADARYTSAPTPTLAHPICRELATRAWHREMTDAEVAVCASFAVDKTNPADPSPKRWAYTCAAVLSASGFLAY